MTTTRTGWSRAQRHRFFGAARAAGWNEQQRYMAMRHVGCRDFGDLGRPSVSHTANTNAQFEQVMAIAEAHAEMNGADVHPPRNHTSWRQASDRGRDRQIGLARDIALEARRRLPGVFKKDPLPAAVYHVTQHDNEDFGGRGFDDIDDCDGGQVYRVVECLRAWVGRYFAKAGLEPETFKQPAEVYRRMAREGVKQGARDASSLEGQPGGGAAPAKAGDARPDRHGRAAPHHTPSPHPGGRVPAQCARPVAAGADAIDYAAATGP